MTVTTPMESGPAPAGRPSWTSRLAPLGGFRADVQVLRGVAVLLVVLYHAQVVAPGGFVGVDVFFVISGFVIGRRLVANLGTRARTHLGGFYAHRVWRILPALAVLLVVVILLAPLLAPIGGVSSTTHTGAAAALFSANLRLLEASTGYFAPAAEHDALLHTWSLSVEEQFYVLVPLVLVGAVALARTRYRSLTTPRLVVGALVVTSFALCVLWTNDDLVREGDGQRLAFFSPVSRAWEFGVGLALVLLPMEWLAPARWRRPLLGAGILLIAIAALTYDDGTRFPGTAALLPVVGAALVIHAGTTREAAATTVASPLRPLQRLGDVSYSWYLWHWPLIVFAGACWPLAGRTPLVVAAVASLLPAWWSYRLVERGVRDRARFTWRATVALALACVLLPVATVVLSRPLRAAVAHRTADTVAGIATNGDVPLVDGAGCRSDERPGESTSWSCVRPGEEGARSIVLFGDSNALQFTDTFVGAAAATGDHLEVRTRGNCPIIDGDYRWHDSAVRSDTDVELCRDFVESTLAAIESSPPDLVVLGVATDRYVVPDGIEVPEHDPEVDADRWSAAPSAYEDALRRILTRVEATGARVALIDVVPKPGHGDIGACSSLRIITDVEGCVPPPFPADSVVEQQQANRVHERAAAPTSVELWDFVPLLCPGGECATYRDGALLYADGAHISPVAARALVPSATRLVTSAPD